MAQLLQEVFSSQSSPRLDLNITVASRNCPCWVVMHLPEDQAGLSCSLNPQCPGPVLSLPPFHPHQTLTQHRAGPSAQNSMRGGVGGVKEGTPALTIVKRTVFI